MFIYVERESLHKQEGGRERRRERIPSRLRAVSTEPNVGLDLMNREVMS